MFKKNNTKIFIIVGIIIYSIAVNSENFGKRTSFNIPLVKLRLTDDEEDNNFKKVRVDISGRKEYAVITRLNDLYVKTTRQGTKRTAYAESRIAAHILSEFEMQQMTRVVQSLISTLEIFEHELQKQRWDKCLYLDSFFPRFMNGFYHLSCAAENTHKALPKIAKIHESYYDVSLNSIKSDKRINLWRKRKDHVIKLRIVTRELIYHLNKWLKKTSKKSKHEENIGYNEELKEAYGLFIQMYFNILI